ncbi:pirin family protein [Variovorax sp. J31P207]|uniref:pirin family protein n=1 Tax=Variovorax sp. J31P207 TaxID=3053510 RepID=UPI0025774A53|nr:pirin family protein [Variovorax sp. J31P207]MDM0065453.1 pirin family protein [Variovorax sp. J31P207]
MSERNVRRAHQRGAMENDWLQARFSFSFGDYQDPNHTHWGSLRALNEDQVAAGRGFAWHGHRDIESLTYPIEGRIHHTDSLGNDYVFGPGELHRMTAGSGIEHAEMNASAVAPERHLQIWLYPQTRGLAPGCELVRIDAAGARDGWRLIASPDGRDGSATVRQRAFLFVGRPARGSALGFSLEAHRLGYLHVVAGAIAVAPGLQLRSGDGLRFTHHETLALVAEAEGSELLLFDL